ncbi:MAG: YlzJ-like family protein [Oscillospiraceae bacterium]
MILHTIIDMNDIFYEENTASNNICCKDVGNIHFQGERSKNGIKIQRIISTNPSDYLNGKYNIGKYIN